MNYARVSLGGALRDVVGRFEQDRFEAVAREFSSDGGTYAARSDDCHVVDGVRGDSLGVAGFGAGTDRSRGALGAFGRVRLEAVGAVFEVYPVSSVVHSLTKRGIVCDGIEA